jgi:hypothetical protein
MGRQLFGQGRVTQIEELESYRFVPVFMQSGSTNDAIYQMEGGGITRSRRTV